MPQICTEVVRTPNLAQFILMTKTRGHCRLGTWFRDP